MLATFSRAFLCLCRGMGLEFGRRVGVRAWGRVCPSEVRLYTGEGLGTGNLLGVGSVSVVGVNSRVPSPRWGIVTGAWH